MSPIVWIGIIISHYLITLTMTILLLNSGKRFVKLHIYLFTHYHLTNHQLSLS